MKKIILTTLCCIATFCATQVSAKITPAQAVEFVKAGKKLGIVITAVPQKKDTAYTINFRFKNYVINHQKTLKKSRLYKDLDKVAKDSKGTVSIRIHGGQTKLTTTQPIKVKNVVCVSYTSTGIIITAEDDRHSTFPTYTTYNFSDEKAVVTVTIAGRSESMDLDKQFVGK